MSRLFKSEHSGHVLRISDSVKSLAKVRNREISWGMFANRLFNPTLDQRYTLQQYKALDLATQADVKNVGYYGKGHFDGGHRKRDALHQLHLVTLDLDGVEAWVINRLLLGGLVFNRYEFIAHTTRKHCSSDLRWRIVIPLKNPVHADDYPALSRILASMIDRELKAIDPVSFRASQIMYWPSVCKGAAFETYHNEGELLDPYELLEAWGDWRDHTKLPRHEDDHHLEGVVGKKPENPLDKKGLIGAFCRTYDVASAIDTFLPEIYIDPQEEPNGTIRYTYSGGTTFHGAVVYDNGLFLYSNHAHDPAAGHSQNAFDLVRLHKFGNLDEKVHGNTRLNAVPSFKAMVDLLRKDDGVSSELRKENYDLDAMFRDINDDGVFNDVSDKDVEVSADWMKLLEVDRVGLVKPTLPNLTLILNNDPRLADCCRFDSFTQRLLYCKDVSKGLKGSGMPSLRHRGRGERWTDDHAIGFSYLLECPPRGGTLAGYGMSNIGKDRLYSAISSAAKNAEFNPVIEKLEATTWDGLPRIDGLLIDYLGVEDNVYTRELSRLTLIATVTRLYEPGHKWDTVPIIEGEQGIGKSTFIEVLGFGWGGHLNTNIEDIQNAVQIMNYAWVLEIPELSQFKKTEVEKLKTFFSTSVDTVRLPFERLAKEFHRHCVFWGSSNESDYLKDTSGNRRFWPLKATVSRIDTERLKLEVAQVYAEARVAYLAMREKQPTGTLPLVLSEGARAIAVVEQNARVAESLPSMWADEIQEWLNKPCSEREAQGFYDQDDGVFDADNLNHYRQAVCRKEIAEKVLKIKPQEFNAMTVHNLNAAMRIVKGWEYQGGNEFRRNRGAYGKQQRCFVRLTPLEPSDLL